MAIRMELYAWFWVFFQLLFYIFANHVNNDAKWLNFIIFKLTNNRFNSTKFFGCVLQPNGADLINFFFSWVWEFQNTTDYVRLSKTKITSKKLQIFHPHPHTGYSVATQFLHDLKFYSIISIILPQNLSMQFSVRQTILSSMRIRKDRRNFYRSCASMPV